MIIGFPRRARLAAALLALGLSHAALVRAQISVPATPVTTANPAEPRFDIDMEDAPAVQFFRGLADSAHNILVHPEVTGRITLSLRRVTVEQVLQAVRDLYGYDYRRVTTGFMILPATVQTRLYSLNYLDVQRDGMSNTRISSGQITERNNSQGGQGSSGGSNNGGAPAEGGQNGKTEVTGSSVVTRNSSDFWAAIETDLRAIVSASGGANRSVVLNRQSGVIVVRALPFEHRDVADYLSRTEATVTRQVVLEAKIIEVELSDTYQAGINWAGVLRDGNKQYTFGQASPPGGFDGDLLAPTGTPVIVAPGNPIEGFVTNALGGAFTIAADFADFSTFIELLKLQGRTRVLSSPRVSTLHNQKAVIKAGTDEFFVTGVESNTTTGTATTTTVDLELTPFFSGVALDVTPQISEHGQVLLHIHPTISDVTDQQKSLSVRGQTDVLPLALSQVRESDSMVKARSGQLIVIGGLMRESRSRKDYKVPLLGDIPGLGRLFRSERDQVATTELVILLRPIVVSDDAQWEPLVKEPQDRVGELEKQGKLRDK